MAAWGCGSQGRLRGHLVTTGALTANGSPSATGGEASALSAEAKSLATGDIPDNQTFLTFRDAGGGYSLVYPEGWAQRRGTGKVEFVEKNNLIRVIVRAGARPTAATVAGELDRERSEQPTLTHSSPSIITLTGVPVVKVNYATLSTPNPVTGKRIRLLVDRYVFARGGRVATLDLGTPVGVDNLDAYRRIVHSFRWL